MKPKISACIICFNDENRIEKCIRTLKPYVDEVVVLDSFSSDSTFEIAKKYADRVYQLPFESYSTQHNKATSLAKNEWVCNVEVDELFRKELWDAVYKEAEKGSFEKYDSFCFPRKTFEIQSTQNYEEQRSHLDLNSFKFTPKSYPNFIDRLHKKDLKFIGDVHPKLSTKRRKFIPVDVLHLHKLPSKEQMAERAKRKEKPLSKETASFYGSIAKSALRFFKDAWFYFNAMAFKLGFLVKGPRYWVFLIRWFFLYFKLAMQILTTGKPHRPN